MCTILYIYIYILYIYYIYLRLVFLLMSSCSTRQQANTAPQEQNLTIKGSPEQQLNYIALIVLDDEQEQSTLKTCQHVDM